jgi:hypothetical protein
VKAKPDITTADFRHHLHSPAFEQLMSRMVELSQAVAHKVTFTLDVPINRELMAQRDGAEPFDALIEVHWSNGRHLEALAESAAFNEVIREIDEYQARFVDFSRSSRFFVSD